MAKDKKKKREERKAKKAAWQHQKEEKTTNSILTERFKSFPLHTVQSDAKDRACNGCTGCCTAVAVHELEKPIWEKCKHECETGCAIYEDRPESCRTYWCLWQSGMLKSEENRPDKIGVIFDLRVQGNIDAISVWELWEGAADQPHVVNLMNEIGKVFTLCVRRYKSSKRRLIGTVRQLKDLKLTPEIS